MKGFHLVPVRGKKFILGRVRHLAGDPGDVKAVKVIKPGSVKVVMVEDQNVKSMVILDDKACRELIDRKWKEYVKTYSAKKKRRIRKPEGTVVEPPVEFTLDDLKGVNSFIEIKGDNFTVFLDRNSISGVKGGDNIFLGLCREIRNFVGDRKVEFDREEVHEGV